MARFQLGYCVGERPPTMPITLRLTTKAPPSAVREAVLHDAAYWREFRVPADLRARGAFGVSATIKGDTFTLWVDSLGRSPPPTYAILVGTVTSDEVEGSIVDARIGLPRTMRRFPLGLIA